MHVYRPKLASPNLSIYPAAVLQGRSCSLNRNARWDGPAFSLGTVLMHLGCMHYTDRRAARGSCGAELLVRDGDGVGD
eukprot:6077198-Prymnesium_polylepis.1